ncbi:MAG: hypothetical protein HRT47_04320 [Candidatus Caenarcaniphilales bacterium]|nr:hypothetical protein [Candidatus Caenarcaniphilales bacterium]
MKTTEEIRSKINRLAKGYVFTYCDFNNEVHSKESIIKALNRMAQSGEIKKLAKGKFYKPESSRFGPLEPPHQQIVKDLLEKDSKLIGYLTGFSAYNQLGLTSQNSHIIEIGRNTPKSSLSRGIFKVKFVLQKNKITQANIYHLQLLDSLKNLKLIPDTTNQNAVKRIKSLIKDLDKQAKSLLISLSLKYSPATRALLGSMLEDLNFDGSELAKLKASLNKVTTYKYYDIESVVKSASNWGIL